MMKKIKASYLAIFIILLMMGSTVAFGALQAIRPTSKGIDLPKTNIIDYELTVEQENYLIQRGGTIAKFYWNIRCLECMKEKNFLEYMANQFQDQIILEEITTPNATESKLELLSYYGQRNLRNATEEEVFNSFCELMFTPPITCAVKSV